MNLSSSSRRPAAALEALEARFALRVAARLSESAEAGSADIAERLRFAREQALERARRSRRQADAAGVVVGGAGSATLAGSGGPREAAWWFKLAAVLPLALLLLGLLEIREWVDRSQIDAAAQIDAELLADDLPPSAYSDPGFVEFLRLAPRD